MADWGLGLVELIVVPVAVALGGSYVFWLASRRDKKHPPADRMRVCMCEALAARDGMNRCEWLAAAVANLNEKTEGGNFRPDRPGKVLEQRFQDALKLLQQPSGGQPSAVEHDERGLYRLTQHGKHLWKVVPHDEQEAWLRQQLTSGGAGRGAQVASAAGGPKAAATGKLKRGEMRKRVLDALQQGPCDHDELERRVKQDAGWQRLSSKRRTNFNRNLDRLISDGTVADSDGPEGQLLSLTAPEPPTT